MDKTTETKITKTFECDTARIIVVEVNKKIEQVSFHTKINSPKVGDKWKWMFTLKRDNHFSNDKQLYDILGDILDVMDAPMKMLIDSGITK